MSGQGAPPRNAERKKRFWFDPRFAIGIALVVVSVLGVVGLVSAADSSVQVLAARNTLTPGERVTGSDLISTSVRSGAAERLYLRASELPAAGVVIIRAVDAGELVPTSAVGSTTGLDLTSVVINVGTVLPVSLVPGSRVDAWAARPAKTNGQLASNSFDAPTVLVSSAIVLRVVDQKNIVAASPGSSVELLVPKSAIASVLEAIANGAVLSVVPVDLPLDP